MTQGKDIIYVNGDSFAEGCDIAGHLYPYFTKNYSLNELLSIDWRQAVDQQHANIQLKHQYFLDNPGADRLETDHQFKMRWSSRLEHYLGRPVLNMSSRGGSSMYAIAFRTIADIIDLKRQGYNITDVIIQITAGGRFSIFKNTDSADQPPRNIRKYNIISTNMLSMDKYQTLAEQFMMHESTGFNGYRTLHDLFMLKHTIASLTDARIIFVDSVFYKKVIGGDSFFTLEECELEENDHIVEFKQQLDREIELNMLECIDPDEPETMTSSMHFTAKVHDVFAKKIAERYFK